MASKNKSAEDVMDDDTFYSALTDWGVRAVFMSAFFEYMAEKMQRREVEAEVEAALDVQEIMAGRDPARLQCILGLPAQLGEQGNSALAKGQITTCTINTDLEIHIKGGKLSLQA